MEHSDRLYQVVCVEVDGNVVLLDVVLHGTNAVFRDHLHFCLVVKVPPHHSSKTK